MDHQTFPEYQALKHRNEKAIIKVYAEELDQIRPKHYRLYRDYNKELQEHYHRKHFNLDLSTLALHRVLEIHKDKLPPKPVNSLLESQMYLFDLPPVAKEELPLYRPSMLLTGQARPLRYDHHYSVNHFDFLHISNWVTFFNQTKLHQPEQLLQDMIMLQEKSQKYLAFLKCYQGLQANTNNPVWHQNLVWSLSDEEWQQFQYNQYHWERFCQQIQELYLFLKHCLTVKHSWVLLRLSYA